MLPHSGYCIAVHAACRLYKILSAYPLCNTTLSGVLLITVFILVEHLTSKWCRLYRFSSTEDVILCWVCMWMLRARVTRWVSSIDSIISDTQTHCSHAPSQIDYISVCSIASWLSLQPWSCLDYIVVMTFRFNNSNNNNDWCSWQLWDDCCGCCYLCWCLFHSATASAPEWMLTLHWNLIYVTDKSLMTECCWLLSRFYYRAAWNADAV